jgi:hypothetical protein
MTAEGGVNVTRTSGPELCDGDGTRSDSAGVLAINVSRVSA